MNNGLDRWRNKVALITGSTTGIGWAIAQAFAESGLDIVMTARTVETLNLRVNELKRIGANVLSIPTDLQVPEQIYSLFKQIRKEWSGIDVLVNNAGVVWREPLLETELSRLCTMIDTNQRAVAIAMSEAVKDMEGKDDAAIINIGSIAGHRVPPSRRRATLYSSTKHALRAMTEGVRTELHARGSNIKVSLISPGLTHSDLHDKAEPSGEFAGFPFRPLDANDIAEAALFLLSMPRHVQVSDIVLRSIEQPD